MAEREVEAASISVSPQNPGEAPASEANPAKEEEPETCRKSKRRKNCAATLLKLEESEPLSICGGSFSFDTKIKSGKTPESTPKFGSFNSAGDSRLLGVKTTAAEDAQSDLIQAEESSRDAVDSTSVGVFKGTSDLISDSHVL